MGSGLHGIHQRGHLIFYRLYLRANNHLQIMLVELYHPMARYQRGGVHFVSYRAPTGADGNAVIQRNNVLLRRRAPPESPVRYTRICRWYWRRLSPRWRQCRCVAARRFQIEAGDGEAEDGIDREPDSRQDHRHQIPLAAVPCRMPNTTKSMIRRCCRWLPRARHDGAETGQQRVDDIQDRRDKQEQELQRLGGAADHAGDDPEISRPFNFMSVFRTAQWYIASAAPGRPPRNAGIYPADRKRGGAFGEAVGRRTARCAWKMVMPLTLWPQTSRVPPASVKRISATRIWCRPNGSSRSPVPKIIGPKSPALLIIFPRALIPSSEDRPHQRIASPTSPSTTVVTIGTKRVPPKKARRPAGECYGASMQQLVSSTWRSPPEDPGYRD